MAEFALLKGSGNVDTHLLPAPYDTWARISGEATQRTAWNTSGMANLNAYVIKALLEYSKGDASDIAVIQVIDGFGTVSFASEWKREDGSTVICSLSGNGVFTASVIGGSQNYSALPSFGSLKDDFDLSSIYLTALLVCAAKAKEGGVYQQCQEMLESVSTVFNLTGELPEVETRILCDVINSGLGKPDRIPCNLDSGGNVMMLLASRVKQNEFDGTRVCGMPDILWATNPNKGVTTVTVGQLRNKAYVKAYVETLAWTDDELELIPDYPDDFQIPTEVVQIVDSFIKSSNMRHPIRNVAWKSGTAYGKSTGVEAIACILHTPLLKLTCFSTMETQDFMSSFVPNTDMLSTASLPSLLEIDADPEGAYQAATGREKPGVTAEDAYYACLEAYAARQSGNRFKLVQSNYIRALRRGYVVEIQEFSRIREKGTLVGLNETFAVGGRLPLVDGSYAKRHKNALSVWTDNVGYISTGPVDASFMRRMDFVLHSRELSKEQVINRVQKNTGYGDNVMLERMYAVWDNIRQHCRENEIDEGDISINELEMWVCMVSIEGLSGLRRSCLECIVTKATSDLDEQDNIMSAVVEPLLSAA